MRALFVSSGSIEIDDYPSPSHGGAIQIWGISKELAKKGHDIFIARRSTTSGKECVENVTLLNFKVNINDQFIGEIISQVVFSLKVSKYIEKIKPDVIYLRDRCSSFFPARLNVPKIYTVYSPDAYDFYKGQAVANKKVHSFLFYYKKWLEENVLSCSDAIVAMNEYMKNYLIRKGFQNVVVIPIGIDINEFSNDGDDNFILYAGRLDWNKRVTVLINAFSEVRRNFNTIDLKIVGSGEKERELKKLVKAKKLQNCVEFLPWMDRSRLLKYMARCSVFVLPSLFENLPNVIAEAMASSKPVIASKTIGAEFLITHGKDGFLFKKNDIDELIRYLELCLSDSKLRQKIGRNARKTIEERFALTRIADQYLEVYHKIQ